MFWKNGTAFKTWDIRWAPHLPPREEMGLAWQPTKPIPLKTGEGGEGETKAETNRGGGKEMTAKHEANWLQQGGKAPMKKKKKKNH
jgi:hypothetical protein